MQYRLSVGILLLLFLAGCGIFKEEKRPERTPVPEGREVPEKKEEVKKKEEVADEKTDSTEVRPEEKVKTPVDKTLNISLFLPFGSMDRIIGQIGEEEKHQDESSDPWTGKQEAVIAFYLGFKLGMEELLQQGIDLEAKVFNTSAWTAGNRDFLNNEDVASADVWIGGYDVPQLKTLSLESAARSTLFVSPFLTTSYFVESNPYFFQMKPSFEMHCRAIARDARNRYHPRQVTVVITEDKKSRLAYFMDSLERDSSKLFRNLTFPSHEEIEEWEVEPYIGSRDTVVFILPMYRDKGFVYTFLSHLSLYVPEETGIVIYGVPPWDKHELLYEFFDRFTLRMSSAHYEHSANPFRLRSFAEQYVNRFGTLPKEESWEGYDLALFLGTSFDRKGPAISDKLGSLYMQGLSMIFEPEPEEKEKRSFFDLKNRPLYYQNSGIYILEFRNDAFRLLPR